MQLKYSIILPCYNEYGNLKAIIPELITLFKKKIFEILIIDDNSPDKTYVKLKKIYRENKKIKCFLRKKNASLALSIKEGIKKSSGKIIIVMDSDYNHRPVDLKKMLKAFEKNDFDMVCGSRFLKGGFSSSFFRHSSSLIFNYFINFLINGKNTDNLSGFFILKKKLITKYISKVFYGYGEYYIRLLYYLNKKRTKIKEIPVRYGSRKYGESKSKLLTMFFLYTYYAIKLINK